MTTEDETWTALRRGSRRHHPPDCSPIREEELDTRNSPGAKTLSGRTLASIGPIAITTSETRKFDEESLKTLSNNSSTSTITKKGGGSTCSITDADTSMKDKANKRNSFIEEDDGEIQKPKTNEAEVEAQIVGQRVEQILFKAKQQLQEMDQYLSKNNEDQEEEEEEESVDSSQNNLDPPNSSKDNNHRVSISASLAGNNNNGNGNRESSFYEYSPIIEKATQVDVSSSSGYPNFHDSSSGGEDTVPSISRQVSISMVRETTQRMESLLGELKNLRRSTSEQKSHSTKQNRDSAYTSGSSDYGGYDFQHYEPSKQQQQPTLVGGGVKAPPTPPEMSSSNISTSWEAPPQKQKPASNHSRSHSLPTATANMATHTTTRPLSLSPLKQQQQNMSQPHQTSQQHDAHPQQQEIDDLEGLMSSLEGYKTRLNQLNSDTDSPNTSNYISAPTSPPESYSKIGQPPSARPPPTPVSTTSSSKPPSIPPTWNNNSQSYTTSLKEEMDHILDSPPIAPFLSKRKSHDSSADSYTTAQSPNEPQQLSEFQRTETGDISQSSGQQTVKGEDNSNSKRMSSPILESLPQRSVSESATRQKILGSPVQDEALTKDENREQHRKSKHKHKKREKKKGKRKEEDYDEEKKSHNKSPQQRPFSQPNIQHLMDLSNNSFRLDEIDLPPDERHLLEKFIDALSKLSVEINMDERKKVEGKRRLQNALRAIEGWI